MRVESGVKGLILVAAVGALAATVMMEKAPPKVLAAAAGYGQVPLHFERNEGQAAAGDFLARGPGYSLLLEATQAALSLKAPGRDRAVLLAQLLDANREAVASAEGVLPGKVNYLKGGDPAQWRTGIPTFERVRYAQVYPGIDLVYYGNQRQLEYDFVVAPGADPSRIRIRYAGAERARVDVEGDLVLGTGDAELVQRKPIVYQQVGAERVEVKGAFVLDRRTEDAVEVAFALGAYDPSRALVIDPVLVYSTYLGGSEEDLAGDIAVDAAGSAYVIGETDSFDFTDLNATPFGNESGSLQLPGGERDVFVTKLNPAGNAWVYSTYLGGSDDDFGSGIGIDATGNAYLTGTTVSANFPTVMPIEGYNADFDAFVAKLNPTGTALLYSTYIGGDGLDIARGLAVDGDGNAYIVGYTDSGNFNTLDPIELAQGGKDAFVAKFGAQGALVYSTYLGGTDSDDLGMAIAVGQFGNAYVVGTTFSTDFNTVNPVEGDDADADVFVAKLTVAGSALLYSTYLGGDGKDTASDIAVDALGRAYVTGSTGSTDFNTVDPIEVDEAGTDLFVTKLAESGGAILYSTYLGGSGDDALFGDGGIAVDGQGSAYVVAQSDSTDFDTLNAIETDGGDTDLVIVKLNPEGSGRVYSTYLGGNGFEGFPKLALDPAGNAYVVGFTRSTDFDTVNAIEGDEGKADIFIAKIGEPAGSVAFSSAGFAVNEDAGTAVVSVIRRGSFAGAISVSFAATAGTAGASDFITVSGTLDWGNGDTAAKTFTVPILNNGAVENGETVLLTLSNPTNGAALNSPSTAVLTIVDDDDPVAPPAAGGLQFAAASFSAGEAAGTATISVIRNGGAAGSVSVKYAATAGTASSGSDFTTANGTLSWGNGDTAAKTFTVAIADDTAIEGDETVTLTLSNPAGGASLGSPSTAVLTVADNEAAGDGAIQFGAAAFSASESVGNAVITLTRSSGSVGSSSIRIVASGGTATPGVDFTAVDRTVTWNGGEAATKTVSVPILQDAAFEGPETIDLTLQTPGAKSLARVVLTIVDDETSTLQFGAAGYSINESGNIATITVTRQGSNAGAVSVVYAAATGTATAPADFTVAGGTLEWAVGDTAAKTFTVAVGNDPLVEGDETIALALSSPTGGAALGSPSTAILSIVDNDVPLVGTVQFGSAVVNVDESAGTVAIAVTRLGGTAGPATVRLGTAAGTAKEGSDFTAMGTTVSFADGDAATKTVSLPIVDDDAYEGVESLVLNLTDATGAALGAPVTATLNIVDDETPPPTTISVDNGGSFAQLTLLPLAALGRRRRVVPR